MPTCTPFAPQWSAAADAAPVADAAGGQHRDLHRVHHLGRERHGGQVPDVAAGLAALGHDRAGAHALAHAGDSHRGHDRHDLEAVFHPGLDVFGRKARAGDDDGHLLLHHNLRHLVGVGRHQHDVDAVRLVRDFADLADLLAELLPVGVHARDDAKAAGVGHRARQGRVRHPGHARPERSGIQCPEDRRFRYESWLFLAFFSGFFRA